MGYGILNLLTQDKNIVTEDELGINIWDEEWEVGQYSVNTGEKFSADEAKSFRSKNFIPVIPNKSYYFKTGLTYTNINMYVFTYDKDKNFIEYIGNKLNEIVTFSNNVYYITFIVFDEGETYRNDITINISNPLYNGNYYPSGGIRRDIANAANAGKFYGLDTSKILASNPTQPYTAIEDCWFYYHGRGAGGNTMIYYVDGVEVSRGEVQSSPATSFCLIPLKIGQKVTWTGMSSVGGNVFGLK